MAEVVLTDISKKYPKGGLAVDRFSLTVRDGEFLVLVGPSGCGKSTTLRMIAGLEDISSGTLLIDGREVNQVPPKDRDIAMVFQNYALYPHMSVYENMAFGLRLRRLPRKEIDARVRDAAESLGLTDYLARLPKQLSGGQRQRVAVGRAIVRKPKVFLFDEPLSNLDAKMRVEMRAEIRRLHRKLGATMIYVTHDQIEAMTMGDRIVVMNGGRIQQAAPPLEVYRAPANRFVASFIGTPPMNMISGKIEERGGGLFFTATDVSFPFPTRPAWARPEMRVIVGFRPESLSPMTEEGGSLSLTGVMDVVEPMGPETDIHLLVGDARLIARLPPGPSYKTGEALTLSLDVHRLSFFAAEEDGRRLDW